MATTSLSFSSSSDVTSKSINYGNSIRLYIRNRVSSNKYKISVSCNGKSEWVLGSDSSYSTSSYTTYSNYNNWQRRELFRDSSYNRHTSVAMVFTLYVYNSSGVQQNTSSVTATITLSSSTPMSIDSTYSAYNTVSGVSGYVQSISKIQHDTFVYSTTDLTQYTVTAELTLAGVKSTITASSIVALSAPNDSNLYKVTLYSPVITTYGSVSSSYKLKFTKSSTYQDDITWNITVSVSAYSAPQITAYGASRFRLDNGQLVKDDSGDYIKFYFTGAVTNVGNNTGQFVIRYRKTNTSVWTNSITVRSGFTGTFAISQSSPVALTTAYNTSTGVPTGTYIVLSAESTWDVNFFLTDTISGKGDSRTLKLSVGFATLEFLAGGKGIAIGKAAELSDTLDVAFKGKFHQNINVTGCRRTVNGIEEDDPNNPSVINGYLTLGRALPVASGGTGATASDFSSSTGKVTKYDSTNQKLYSANLVADDIPTGISANKITGLGSLAFLSAVPFHNHSTSDISSGTLSVARGGTGKSSWANNNIVLTNSNGTGLTSTGSLSLGSDYISGTLPIGKGGTGITLSTASGAGALYHNSSASALSCGALPIACGGTGATSAAAALSNLGIDLSQYYKKKHDTVSIYDGGTGSTYAEGARHNLRIYSGTINITTKSSWNSASIYDLSGASDNYAIIVTVNQVPKSGSIIEYYVQRDQTSNTFVINVRDRGGVYDSTGTAVTYGWVAIKTN